MWTSDRFAPGEQYPLRSPKSWSVSGRRLAHLWQIKDVYTILDKEVRPLLHNLTQSDNHLPTADLVPGEAPTNVLLGQSKDAGNKRS